MSENEDNEYWLNLPQADLKVRNGSSGQHMEVFDQWRRRWVALTPEEWVRQHFVAMLVNEKGFPAGSIGNEVALTLNNTRRRCDTIIYGADRDPLMIIEYKAPTVNVTQAVFDQIVRYNMVLKARYLVVSNGLVHFCCEIDYENSSYRFLKEIPHYQSMV